MGPSRGAGLRGASGGARVRQPPLGGGPRQAAHSGLCPGRLGRRSTRPRSRRRGSCRGPQGHAARIPAEAGKADDAGQVGPPLTPAAGQAALSVSEPTPCSGSRNSVGGGGCGHAGAPTMAPVSECHSSHQAAGHRAMTADGGCFWCALAHLGSGPTAWGWGSAKKGPPGTMAAGPPRGVASTGHPRAGRVA